MEFDDAYQAGWEYALKAVQDYGKKGPSETPLRVYVGKYIDSFIKKQMHDYRPVKLSPEGAGALVNQTLADNQRRIEQRRPIMSDVEMGELLKIPVGPPSTPPRANTTGDVRRAITLTRLMGSIDHGLSSHNADFSDGSGYDVPMRSIFDERIKDENDPTGDDATRRAMIGRFGVIIGQMYEEAKSQRPAVLSERDMQVLRMRYGLFDGTPKYAREIGKIFGLTEQRIRQLEQRALKRLRGHPDIKSLRSTDTD